MAENYGVSFVEDDALPTGHDWALVRTRDTVLFFVKRSAVSPDVIAEGWAAYRGLQQQQLLAAG